MKIDTGLQVGTAIFGCMCVCFGLRIGDWFGVEVIQKYFEMCKIGLWYDFHKMRIFLERKHGLEMDGKTHSKVNGYIRDSASKRHCAT